MTTGRINQVTIDLSGEKVKRSPQLRSPLLLLTSGAAYVRARSGLSEVSVRYICFVVSVTSRPGLHANSISQPLPGKA